MKSIALPSRSIWGFIQLTRPVFLLGGLLMFSLGALLAVRAGAALDPTRFLLGLSMVTLIQLTAQYANEYYDYEGDRLNDANRTWLTGGSGVLSSGAVRRQVARSAFIVTGAASLLFIALVFRFSPLAGWIGLLGLAGGYLYSAPPAAFMRTGWGELEASVVVALLVPLTGYAVQTGSISAVITGVSFHLVLVHLAMLIGFEIPDGEADQANDKRTLRVRLGLPGVVVLHTALVLASYALLPLLLLRGITTAGTVFLSAPMAVFQCIQVARAHRLPRGGYRSLTLGALALFLSVSVLWFLGFLMEG